MIPFDLMPFYFFKKRWCSTINVFIFHHRININLQKCIINLFSFLAHDTIGFSLSMVKSRHGKPHFPWFNLFSFLAHDTIGFSLSLVKSRHGKPHFPWFNLFSFLAHDTIGFSLSLVKSRHGKPPFPWFNLFSFLAHDTIGFSLSLVKSRHGKPHFPCFNQCLVGYLLELKSGRERRRRALTVSVI